MTVSLTPVNVETFRGLDLLSDPEQVGWDGAVDLLNVTIANGRVYTRYGSSLIGITPSGVTSFSRPFPFYLSSTATLTVVAGANNNNVYAVSASGVEVTHVAYTNAIRAVRFAAPGSELLYFCDAAGAQTVAKWNGAAFTTGAIATYTPKYLAVQPTDNRLVLAATSSTDISRVRFSDAGTPETVGANNYVDLTPGDGETIAGMATWRDLLFVFKNSKFFVFYGNSTDSTGNPVFNYRAVVGVGAVSEPTVAEDGVYFASSEGIFRTTGGPPEKVSASVDPLFQVYDQSSLANAAPLFAGSEIAPYLTYLASARGLVLVASGTSSIAVLDTRSRQWTYWSFPYNVYPTGGPASLPVVRDNIWFGGSNKIGAMGINLTTDNGTAIVSRYRSGFSDVGLPGREKTVRETELVGQGSPTFGWSRDFGSITTTSSQAVTLGTAPATARALHRLSQNGELLSWQASATSGAWQLNRVTPMLRVPRQPGEKTT